MIKKRIKLSVKSEKEKKHSLKKKLEEKLKKVSFSDLFSNPQDKIFASSNIITDNNWLAILTIDSDNVLINEKIKNPIEIFDINEDDLQIEFNKEKPLEPYKIDDDIYIFESIGSITKNQYDWFKQNYPNCVFYQILKWFGKEVNTLIIVLAEELGKPVGIIKTS